MSDESFIARLLELVQHVKELTTRSQHIESLFTVCLTDYLNEKQTEESSNNISEDSNSDCSSEFSQSIEERNSSTALKTLKNSRMSNYIYIYIYKEKYSGEKFYKFYSKRENNRREENG